MKRRTQDKLAATVALILLLALAAGTFYLAEITSRTGAEASTAAPGNEPDSFAEQIALIKVNRRGEAVFRMAAQRMWHYPVDGATAYEMPRLVSLDPSRPVTSVTADRARANRDGTVTVLEGDVVLSRAASGDDPELIVRTPSATLYSETEIARSTERVLIEHGDTRLTGIGMEFNNELRQLRVESEVRGVWVQPPPAR